MNIRLKSLIILCLVVSVSNNIVACQHGCTHSHNTGAGTGLSGSVKQAISFSAAQLIIGDLYAAAKKGLGFSSSEPSSADALEYQARIIAQKQRELEALPDGSEKTQKTEELKKLKEIHTDTAFGLTKNASAPGHQHGPGCKH